MKKYVELRIPSGVLLKDAKDNVANDLIKNINFRLINGKHGEKHPFQKQTILNWIEESCLKRRYINEKDIDQRDYLEFQRKLYSTIWQGRIRRDTLTKDTDKKHKTNELYYPGLVHIMGKGWIVTDTEKTISEFKKQRNNSLNGQKLHLCQKCNDALDFVKALPERQVTLLDDGDGREIA